MYLQYSRPILFFTFCQMLGRRRTPSAQPSLLMFRIDRPIARISLSLVLYGSLAAVLSLWRSDRNRMDSGENDDTWWYGTPSIMTMQGVTPLLLSRTFCAADNGRFWNIHRTSGEFSDTTHIPAVYQISEDSKHLWIVFLRKKKKKKY